MNSYAPLPGFGPQHPRDIGVADGPLLVLEELTEDLRNIHHVHAVPVSLAVEPRYRKSTARMPSPPKASPQWQRHAPVASAARRYRLPPYDAFRRNRELGTPLPARFGIPFMTGGAIILLAAIRRSAQIDGAKLRASARFVYRRKRLSWLSASNPAPIKNTVPGSGTSLASGAAELVATRFNVVDCPAPRVTLY